MNGIIDQSVWYVINFFWYLLNPVNNEERRLVKQKLISARPISIARVVVVLVKVKILVFLSNWF